MCASALIAAVSVALNYRVFAHKYAVLMLIIIDIKLHLFIDDYSQQECLLLANISLRVCVCVHERCVVSAIREPLDRYEIFYKSLFASRRRGIMSL